MNDCKLEKSRRIVLELKDYFCVRDNDGRKRIKEEILLGKSSKLSRCKNLNHVGFQRSLQL